MMTDTTTTRSRERFLAIIGAASCLVISIRIWQVLSGQQPMWPLPSLYLLEMVAVGFAGTLGILKSDSSQSRLAGILTWAAVGVFAAFIVMGAWSIGLLFLPAGVLLLIAAILADRRRSLNSVMHLGVAAFAAIIQVALMLAVIRIIYPDAVF